MDFRMNPRLLNDIHNSVQTERVLGAVARQRAPRVAAVTPVDTGGTGASTRVETGHRSADGRSVAARIVQGQASVPNQFGNSRTRAARQFDQGLGGGE